MAFESFLIFEEKVLLSESIIKCAAASQHLTRQTLYPLSYPESLSFDFSLKLKTYVFNQSTKLFIFFSTAVLNPMKQIEDTFKQTLATGTTPILAELPRDDKALVALGG